MKLLLMIFTSGSFEILDDNSEVMGTHESYNILKSVSVVVGKNTTSVTRLTIKI